MERKLLKVKEWFYDREQAKASGYNRYFNVLYKDGRIDRTDGYVTIDCTITGETEKAVSVTVETGMVVGSCLGWKTWIPKSVIM